MTVLRADEATIHGAANALAAGRLVAFPTETVYGLGADGLNPAAVQRIFAVKGRPADHPVILHVANVQTARSLAAHWPAMADQLANAFWPGPLTLILRRAAAVSDRVTGGQDTVGVRMPAHTVAMRLLAAFAQVGSGVIAAPSANRFGAVSPTRAADVAAGIGDRLAVDDVILDGGDCDVGVESTIIDLSGGQARLLRPGGISRDAIERVLGKQLGAPGGDVPRVSGALESHYAPRAKTLLCASREVINQLDQLQSDPQTASASIAALVMHPELIRAIGLRSGVVCMPISADPRAYAHDLYARLNDADRQSVQVLLIEAPPALPAWEAVNDRLRRACTAA